MTLQVAAPVNDQRRLEGVAHVARASSRSTDGEMAGAAAARRTEVAIDPPRNMAVATTTDSAVLRFIGLAPLYPPHTVLDRRNPGIRRLQLWAGRASGRWETWAMEEGNV